MLPCVCALIDYAILILTLIIIALKTLLQPFWRSEIKNFQNAFVGSISICLVRFLRLFSELRWTQNNCPKDGNKNAEL